MDNNVAPIIIAIFSTLSTVGFLLLIVGLFKPSLVVRGPSLQTRKGVFLIWGLSAIFFTGGSLLVTGITEPTAETSSTSIYYVGVKSANVRECPSTSCKIIDTLFQNEKLTFPGDLYDKYPEWVEVTFPNGQLGYVSKTVLSENAVSASQLTPTDDSSSIGGIIIGPWNNIQTKIGESYEFRFCEPPSAISGATCGSLADTTTDPKGGTPPYSFIKKSGFLPPGMALELNGTLKGTPTQEGTYNFRLCAKDLYGGEGCQGLAVIVNKNGTSPISPISTPVQTTGTRRYTVSFSAEGSSVQSREETNTPATFQDTFRGGPITVDALPNGVSTEFEMPFTIEMSITAQPRQSYVCIVDFPGYSAKETFTGTLPHRLRLDPHSQRLTISFDDLSGYISDIDSLRNYENPDCRSRFTDRYWWRHEAWENILDWGSAFDSRKVEHTVGLDGGTINGGWEPTYSGETITGKATYTITPDY